jgi:hypothetical protein
MRLKSSLIALVVSILAFAGPAFAGEGNVLYLIQEGGDGNRFLADQSAANYSRIGSIAHPALQDGDNNTANVTISANCPAVSSPPCATLALTQDNTASPTTSGNTATVTITGAGNATIEQVGDINTATMILGSDGDGLISQDGLSNTARLDILGGADGSISQNGNSNDANLQLIAGELSSIVLTQSGNGNQYGSAGTSPAVVMTTQPGQVTYTQMSF